jgi:uncharacterized OB-fold protein
MSEDQHTGEKKFIEEGWFKDSPEGLVLVGSKCDACGKVFFPKKKVCPNCFEGQLRDVPLSKRGKLHSYTLSILGPPDMEKPFLCGFIDLPEGIKLYSLLTECDPWDKALKMNMDMEMVIDRIKNDEKNNEIIAYKFKPIKKEEK